ncbi:NADH-cytochrome b5 reductase, partial [Nowakowskiella sp. JEL0078]
MLIYDKHVSLSTEIDGKIVSRSYTPVSSTTDTYPSGIISSYVDKMKIGESASFRGPNGGFIYTPNMVKSIGMIAGGTGITPMYQIIKAIIANPDDVTEVNLIFANVNESDILLRDELENIVANHKNIKLFHVLNIPPENWTGGVGFVSKEIISQHCPPPTQNSKILICGPPPMVKAMATICEDLGYEKPRALSKRDDQ